MLLTDGLAAAIDTPTVDNTIVATAALSTATTTAALTTATASPLTACAIQPQIIIIIIIMYVTCMLIDVAISGDRNVINKEAEKILKYKDLTIEIQRMWNVKTKVIPVIIGASGTISKSFRKYVSNIPGNHEVKELKKTAILGTAHIIRKVLI